MSTVVYRKHYGLGSFLFDCLMTVLIARRALRDITRCDYRGNEPSEQMIARLALADIERVLR